MTKLKQLIIAFTLFLLSSPMRAETGKFLLFPQEIKEQNPSVVYDFLESYLFELDSLSRLRQDIDLKLHDDKFIFVKGTPATARTITPLMPFSISKMEDKYYEVCWRNNDGKPVLHVAFPVQYELILGKTRTVLENDLQNVLNSIGEADFYNEHLNDSLIVIDDNYLRSKDSKSYYVEGLNNAIYMQKVKTEYVPVFSSAKNDYSASNLFQGIIKDCLNYKLYVEQTLYGFKKKSFLVSLWQWLTYCRRNGLMVYSAVEEEREDGLKVLLIAQSHELGYNHMLSVIIPYNFTEKRDIVIKGNLNAFIPCHNVKDLYQQYKKRAKKRI